MANVFTPPAHPVVYQFFDDDDRAFLRDVHDGIQPEHPDYMQEVFAIPLIAWLTGSNEEKKLAAASSPDDTLHILSFLDEVIDRRIGLGDEPPESTLVLVVPSEYGYESFGYGTFGTFAGYPSKGRYKKIPKRVKRVYEKGSEVDIFVLKTPPLVTDDGPDVVDVWLNRS